MKVKLRFAAQLSKVGVIGPGIVDWPEDVALPKTAEALDEEMAEEDNTSEPDSASITLKDLTDKPAPEPDGKTATALKDLTPTKAKK